MSHLVTWVTKMETSYSDKSGTPVDATVFSSSRSWTQFGLYNGMNVFANANTKRCERKLKRVTRGNLRLAALAANSARMFRALESSIQKPHKSFLSHQLLNTFRKWLYSKSFVDRYALPSYLHLQDENPWATFSGHGFGYIVREYILDIGEYILDQGRVQDPNLAGSSDLHSQEQKMSDGAEVRIEIPDEDDSHIPDHASFGQDAAFALYCNHQKPANGKGIIEVPDEEDGLSGSPWMPNFGSGATNFAVASSSGIDKFAGDDSESSNEAQDVPSGPYLNHPEADTVSEMPNHYKDDPALTMNSNVSAHETKFQPEVNTIVAAVAGQAIASFISSSSTDSTCLTLFAAASGVGFLGSFFAMYSLKRPKVAKIMSKIGAIGTGSAVIVALGGNLLRDTNWYLMVGGRAATWAACLIAATAVVMTD